MTNLLPIAQHAAPLLKIGDLARRAERSTRAVRLYEEMGLLGDVCRTEGGHRLYDERAVLRMNWIDKLQLLGFSLPRIRELLSELEDAEHGPVAMSTVRQIFQDKLEETQAQIKGLQALTGELQDSLRYLESCASCEPSTLLCACTDCEYPHSVAPTTLIAGLHSCGHTGAATATATASHES